MSITELKQKTRIKEGYANNRYNEKVNLTKLRFDLGIKMLEKRDKFAKDRHKERIEILANR